MKFTTIVAAFASTATAMEWLSVVPLHERQLTSGPKYECHEDCGYTILGASGDSYCTNSTWTDLFEGCLECANEFDIWKHYGTGVTKAAEGCDLDATPVAASNSNATTTTGTSATGSTASPTSSGSAESTEEASGAGLNKPAVVVLGAAVVAALQLL